MIISYDKELTIKDFYPVLFDDQKLVLEKETLNRIDINFAFLNDYIQDKIIYGVNTGLGPMAQYKIDENSRSQLQYNLIRSHAAGMGDPIDDHSVKASMINRLNCFARGCSGVHRDLVTLLANIINHDIFPMIPEHGGVGASGDLVQLAHLALVLIGEGKVKYRGEWQATQKVFDELNLKPLDVHIREGLALVNGTSFMAGIGVVNLLRSRNLLNWAVIASVILNELVESFNDHYSVELNARKKHKGQFQIASVMSKLLTDSRLISRNESSLYKNTNKNGFFISKRVQEFYSIRCVPQILGPVYDTLVVAESTLANEINSVNDNPVIDDQLENVIHGGNFHGDYVSLEMDKLKIVMTRLAMLSERQLNFLLNDKINKILPPFVNLGVLGLNFGMQGAQFTATSTTAECQTLSNPMYVHSIPTNNDNQDVVSMGTNAALITKKVINNAYEVLSVELIALLQAIEYLKFTNKLSDYSAGIYEELRNIVPRFSDDYPLHDDMIKIKNYIMNKRMDLLP